MNWNNIAEFDFSVAIEGVNLTEQEFQKIVNLKQPVVNLRGKWVVWDLSTAEQLQEKIETFKDKKKLTYMDAYQLQQNDDEAETVHWNTKWNETIEQLLKDLTVQTWEQKKIPSQLKGTLRPYQHQGFSWLLNMRKLGFGACLADDMGLGKTIQTIAYILAVNEAKLENKIPILLICPTSLIGNWEHEFGLFAPHLTIYIHHGPTRMQQEELQSKMRTYDVIVTSYALAVRDEALWTSVTWNGLILDEAQHIKNIETKQRRTIKQIQAIHRIALTGTPIENRLKELWSIIDLLNDHFLGSFSQFQSTYIRQIEAQEQNKDRLNELKKLISIFLLRRTKQDKHIHLQLPEKTELVHEVGLTIEQASLYQAVINDLFEKIDVLSEMERRALILSSLTRLKQICNHPAHYLKDNGKLTGRSQKWEKMIELTESFTKNKEKGLIFTQYKQMGLLIQKGLETKYGIRIPFLHGSLLRQNREQLIEEFRQGDAPVFILSLKAGGVGLNLTAANHVIHYDRWWNPAVENQATDRVYRIGQLQDVTVHKLVTKGTLEEKIHAMLERKQKLSDQILNTNENRLSELTTDELQQFLKLRLTSF
ncbi:MAG: DEAD/DEAH box helicase [Bacillaceae bacterium]|nr:DEAD/DEAH box helicase [Bacillaceae bacterium]